MPVTPTYPGVYIEEVNSLSLSVSVSPTAVPVFPVPATNTTFAITTRVSSWMDYQNKKGSAVFDSTDILDLSMRTYFENGGGYCYLVPLGDFSVEVPKLIDATLLVAAGQDISAHWGTLCGPGKCLFAILDGPKVDLNIPDDPLDLADDITPPAVSIHAATYYPWLSAPWAAAAVPPSAAMAGVYCTVDLTRGVWKAPANVTLKGGLSPQFPVTDDLQGQHMGTTTPALNMIRVFSNGATTVWGARTQTVGTDVLWRYVPVRRLFDSAERDIKRAMEAAMFEPNSQPTWEETRASITNYLYSLWCQGGLFGAKPEDAFFVHIGKDVTMTQDDIDQGKMIVRVGMAAVRPAEFIILQFTQDMAQ